MKYFKLHIFFLFAQKITDNFQKMIYIQDEVFRKYKLDYFNNNKKPFSLDGMNIHFSFCVHALET